MDDLPQSFVPLNVANSTTRSVDSSVTRSLLLRCVQFTSEKKINLRQPFGYVYISQSKPLTPWFINETTTKRISCGTAVPWRKINFLRKVNKLSNPKLKHQNVTEEWMSK